MAPARGRNGLTGTQRAAVVMLALGEEHGAHLWTLMQEEEIRDISDWLFRVLG